MLTIATYVLLGVITVIHGFVLLDEQKMHERQHEEPQGIESASPQCSDGDTHEMDKSRFSDKGDFI